MSSSDHPVPSSGHGPLLVESDLDVRISLYNGSGTQIGQRYGELSADVPAGLYRIEVERAGRIASFVVEHDGDTTLRPPAPALQTPAPIAGAATSHDYYTNPAAHFSVATTAPGLGPEPRTSHLLIFIRCEARDREPRSVPSEPISVRDVNGRLLATLTNDHVHRDEQAGYVAYAANLAPGIYRLRAERSRRDFAVAIPPHRAAQVFIADCGDVRLDDLRLFLPAAGQRFVPSSPVGHAMEAVLDALRWPHGELPSSIVPLLSADELDLCLGIAAAHLLLRSGGDAPLLGELIERIAPYADHIPDVAILEHVWRRRRGEPIGPLALSAPPMLHASFLAAMTGPDAGSTRIPVYSAIAQSARGGHHDTVWWTWSARPWDAHWIESTIDGLLARGGTRNLLSIARTIALPVATIAHTIAQIDATIPQIDHTALAIEDMEIPGYVRGEMLGRGSQGVVYRAIRKQDGQPVAIKVIAFTGNRRLRQAAMREIQAMEPLDHPSLLRLAESGPLRDDSGMWLEVELCRGSVLDRLTELGGPMSVDEAWMIMCKALEGVAYLHRRGIIHRDIKPANLLIRSDNSVAVADFGLARSAAVRSTRPRAGGTARFAPPEQLVDVSQATAASDVWSAAATLYFMLTLELPRDEHADQSELDAAQHNPVVPIAERRPDLPPALARIIDAALSAETFRRPQNAASLLRHLSAVLRPRSHGSPRSGRALVIGETTSGLLGIENDTRAIAAWLIKRGFDVDICTNAYATGAVVRDRFDRLVAATHAADSVVLYYAGRAFSFTEGPSHGDAVFSIAIPSEDSLQLLALPLGRLLANTRNVTVITDACLSAGATFSAPSLPVVQISGCGADGMAFEYANARGERRGVFTESLVEIFQEIGPLTFSWTAIGRAVRARVIRRFPNQSPQFLGPVGRQPFSLENGDDDYDDDGVYEVHREGDHYVLRGGDITGVVVGDCFAAMPPGSFSYDGAAALGELEVVEVLPAVANAKFTGDHATLPEGVVAVPITKQGAKRPVAIDLRPVSPRFVEAISAAPTLRIARLGEHPIATVRARDGELTIEDDLGLLTGPGELGRHFGPVIRQLSNLAAAQALRELEGEYGIALDEVDTTLATVVDGDVRLLPRHRAVLGLSDQLRVSVANRSHRPLFAHVFGIGPRGDIFALSTLDPTGILIEPGAPPHMLRGITLSWGSNMPRTTPRVVDIVAIITSKPTRLDRLATDEVLAAPSVDVERVARGNQRSVYNSALHDLFDQLHDGQAREVRSESVDEFFVTRLPLLLVPLAGELSRLAFELDREPLARNIARALGLAQDPKNSTTVLGRQIAIRLADVAARSASRLDAVICTQSEDGQPVMWTSIGDHSAMQIFAGRVRGFIDIAIFVSPGDGPSLAELLESRSEAHWFDEVASALRSADSSCVALALGATALLTRRVCEVLRAAFGTTHCLYHASFLAEDDFGVGRHPASGVNHCEEISFAVAIEGPRSMR